MRAIQAFAVSASAVGLVAAAGPAAADATQRQAEEAARSFVQQMDTGDPGTIYRQQLGAAFQGLMDESTFIQQTQALRVQAGGAAKERSLIHSFFLDRMFDNVGQSMPGHFYFVRFRSVFPETVVFQDVTVGRVENNWKVHGLMYSPIPPD